MNLQDRTPAELVRAIEIIADRLLGEAERRDWCEDYNCFASDTNEQVGFDVLTERRPALKRVHYTISFTVDSDYRLMDRDAITQRIKDQGWEYADSIQDFNIDITEDEL